MKISFLALAIAAASVFSTNASAQQSKLTADPAVVDRYIAATFKGASEKWR